jgi:hypothetical protein
MSVAVGIDKCIREGYVDTVACNVIPAVFVAVRNNQLNHKRFYFMKDTSIMPFPTWREQGRRESTLTE